MQEQQRHRNYENRKPRITNSKPKYEGKGHDAILKRFMAEDANVNFVLSNGNSFFGKIIATDKYTITVKESTIDHVVEVTVFKHGIIAFFKVEK